ncbi:glycoside hydrolase domain-containing protein, partial [Enterococcus faecalis]|uniref:glycoside hydrolase domain-containing protein n=1 Tax=Enterococcus faecalis TaxID=1351 RepID=UPI003D6A0F56
QREHYGPHVTLDYLKYGYVPSIYHESVNHTLDYSYSDFCISQVAKTLNHSETATFYRQEALNYQEVFTAETGFMQAKHT